MDDHTYTPNELIALRFPTRVTYDKATEEYVLHWDDREAYHIHKEDIKTPRDVLKWVRHISEKTWITKEHIDQLIVMWGSRNNVNIF